MSLRRKWWMTGSLVLVAILYGATSFIAAGDIGRSNPSLASLFRPIWFNFNETYVDGQAMGFAIGTGKDEVIAAVFENGYEVQPSCWGDNRAGGESLYTRNELIDAMQSRDAICIGADRTSIILRFSEATLRSVEVTFVRNELI